MPVGPGRQTRISVSNFPGDRSLTARENRRERLIEIAIKIPSSKVHGAVECFFRKGSALHSRDNTRFGYSKFPKLFGLRDVGGSEISLGTSFSRELSGDGHFEASFERGQLRVAPFHERFGKVFPPTSEASILPVILTQHERAAGVTFRLASALNFRLFASTNFCQSSPISVHTLDPVSYAR